MSPLAVQQLSISVSSTTHGLNPCAVKRVNKSRVSNISDQNKNLVHAPLRGLTFSFGICMARQCLVHGVSGGGHRAGRGQARPGPTDRVNLGSKPGSIPGDARLPTRGAA